MQLHANAALTLNQRRRMVWRVVEQIALLRGLRMTGAEIAFCLGMALSTVSAVLKRIGLGKLSRLEPPEPPNRYERRHPGELIDVDVKSSAGSAVPGIA